MVVIPQVMCKWNEPSFRPLLCTYRLNWPRRTSWGWWDEWGDTALQTQDSKFKAWRSEAEHALGHVKVSFTSGWGRNIFISFKPPKLGNKPRTLAWKACVGLSYQIKIKSYLFKICFCEQYKPQRIFSRFVVLKNQQYYSEICVFD